MKISDLKKEILLVLLSNFDSGKGTRSLTVDAVVDKLKIKRGLSFSSPRPKPPRFVCVQRSLERLARDGLVNVELSVRFCLDSYYLNSRGKRRAEEIKKEISNYIGKWWDFVRK